MDAMGARDNLMRELAEAPEPLLEDVLAFVRARKRHVSEAALLSQSSLAADWDRPEEDAAWAGL